MKGAVAWRRSQKFPVNLLFYEWEFNGGIFIIIDLVPSNHINGPSFRLTLKECVGNFSVNIFVPRYIYRILRVASTSKTLWKMRVLTCRRLIRHSSVDWRGASCSRHRNRSAVTFLCYFPKCRPANERHIIERLLLGRKPFPSHYNSLVSIVASQKIPQYESRQES